MDNKPVFTAQDLIDGIFCGNKVKSPFSIAPWETLATYCNAKIAPLLDENKRLREALEFYADLNNYISADVEDDGGDVARKALEGK